MLTDILMKGLLVAIALIYINSNNNIVQSVKVEVESYGSLYHPQEQQQQQQQYIHQQPQPQPQQHYEQEYQPQYYDQGAHQYDVQHVAPVAVAPTYPSVGAGGGGHRQKVIKKKQKGQDFSKIPGQAGVDFPIYHEVPHTNFHCGNVPAVPGMYANVETGCQAYHVCHDGREGDQGAKFLCTNGTIFNQKEFTCDWWYNVNCDEATSYYHLNADPEHNPYFPKKKIEDENDHGKFVIHA